MCGEMEAHVLVKILERGDVELGSIIKNPIYRRKSIEIVFVAYISRLSQFCHLFSYLY